MTQRAVRPVPPYDVGSPAKAPAGIVAYWRGQAEKVPAVQG